MTADLTPWHEQAVAEVVHNLYANHPDLEQRFGARGRQVCREDTQHHLSYLQAALEADEPTPFAHYALWLGGILGSRGVPLAHLRESFDLLTAFFAQHLSADDSARVTNIIASGRQALTSNDLPAPYTQMRLPARPEAPDYCEAALQGRHAAALGLVSGAMQAGASLSQTAVCIIQPAMYEIGRRWQENQITVAQEHLATAVSQNVLARAYLQAEFAPLNARRALFACVPGNHHSLGLRILSDSFETVGWETTYLGADVPIPDLLRQVEAQCPELLALSLSLPSHLTEARQTIELLHGELGNACPEIWVGGLITLGSERLWSAVKADGWAADALHALEQIKA